MQEQRQALRADLDVAVDLESEHNFFTGFVRNISDGGLFIATTTPFPIGTRIAVRLRIPSFERDEMIVGVVKWVRSAPRRKGELPGGVGIAFLDLDSAVARKIDAFISQHESIFYDGD